LIRKLALFSLFACTSLLYAHNNGGEIFYQYVGNQSGYQNGDYLIYATVYMDTGAYDTAAPIPDFEIYQGFQFLQKVTPQHLSSDQPMPPQYILSETNAYGWFPTPAYNRPGNRNWWAPDLGQGCAGQRPTIEARYVALINLPLNSYQIIFKPGCCRFTDNIAQGDTLVLRTDIRSRYPLSSQRFGAPANLKICIDTLNSSSIKLRNNFWSPEIDTLKFSLQSAFRANGDSVFPPRVVYAPGFAGNAPLPSRFPQSINNRTGHFSFTPDDTGNFSVVVRLREIYFDATWGLGTWFSRGFIYRELPIEIVRGCAPLGRPQHLFSSINPSTLEYETFALADSSQGDFASLFWNGQWVNDAPSYEPGATRLNYQPAVPLINLPYKFAVGASDWCGRSTAPGAAHETIALGITKNGNRLNLTWTPYQGQTVQQYRIYSLDSSRQNLTLLDSVNGNTLQRSLSLQSAQYLVVEGVLDTSLVPADWPFQGPVGMNEIPTSGIGLRDEKLGSSLVLFPNPAQAQITVNRDSKKATAYVIANALGQEVLAGTLKGTSAKIEVSVLPPGWYSLRTEDGATQTFLKE